MTIDPTQNTESKAILKLDHLTKGYQEGGAYRDVVRDVSAEFKPGEITAILGKSGSGKSTILNLISGIDIPESGKIFYEGVDLTAMNDLKRTYFRREKIGFVFQFYNLIPTLNVWENLTLPLELNRLRSSTDYSRAENLLEEVGLLNRKTTFPDRLSGGEQQRVAIARALVHNPVLVLADEPTGNLDEETGRMAMNLLNRLTRQARLNMILVTHSPESASYADRIFHLVDGKFIQQAG